MGRIDFVKIFRNVFLSLGILLLVSMLEILIRSGGTGFGFPFRFFAMGLFGFISAGYFKLFNLIADVIFWYAVVSLVLYYRRNK